MTQYDSRLSGSCPDCGHPVVLDWTSEYKYGEMKWIKRKHECKFIPEEIKALFDHKKIRKIVKEFRVKYGINSDDKIIMVTAPQVLNCLMDSIDRKFDYKDKSFFDWWYSGFPISSSEFVNYNSDHYQLEKYARDLCILYSTKAT